MAHSSAVHLLATLGDPGRHEFEVTGAQVVSLLVSALVSAGCVLFHYEALSWLSRLLPALKVHRRMRIVGAVLGILLMHVVEVWIFALTYWLLDYWPSLGMLPGAFEEGAMDFVYYSVVTYTTLGFGDIIPTGSLRILTGAEALVGLTMITWSASFMFLEMQRDWAEFRRRSGFGPKRLV